MCKKTVSIHSQTVADTVTYNENNNWLLTMQVQTYDFLSGLTRHILVITEVQDTVAIMHAEKVKGCSCV